MPVPRWLLTLRERVFVGRPVGERLRWLAVALLAVTVAVAGWVVFSPGPPARGGQSVLHHWSAVWRAVGAQPAFLSFETVESAANVVMFLPIGFLAAAAVRPAVRFLVVPLAMAGSVFIEVVQLFVPERVSSVEDVLANSTGAVLGVLLLVHLTERAAWRSAGRPEPARI